MIRLRFSVSAVIFSMFVSPVVYWKRIQPACQWRRLWAGMAAGVLGGVGRTDNPAARRQVSGAVLLLGIACCGFATGGAAGSALQVEEARPPSPAEAMRTWQEVEGWIRSWRLPPDAAGFPASAACVTLRLNGEVVGRGEDFRGDDRSVWRAAMAAMDQAASNVVTEGVVPNDALRTERLRMVGERMTVGIELAGALTPFAPATYAEVETTLSPGVHGVAVRRDRDVYGFFPGTMLSLNMLPHEALANRAATVVGNAAAGLEEPGKLAERHKLVFYRFETVHLAQTSVNEAPIFLRRGGRLVLREQITMAELVRMGRAMSAHLAGRVDDADGGTIREGYRPWLGRYDGREGGAALLLAGIALQAWQEHGADDAGAEAVAVARRAALRLSAAAPVEEGQTLPLAFATVLVARGLEAETADASDREWLRQAAAALASLHDAESGFAPQVRSHERAPVAWALAEASAALGAGGEPVRAAAAGAVRRLYRETPEGRLVQHMPWLGWAELRLVDGAEQVPAATALRRMREQIWSHQVTPLDVEESGHDVVGGIVFTATSNPLPDWHTLRPVAFAASMLGEPRLTDQHERAMELARLLSSLRFARQLQADESQMWMFRDAAASVGGVRAGLWDQRMPADATSLGLLAVSETLGSLRALSEAP